MIMGAPSFLPWRSWQPGGVAPPGAAVRVRPFSNLCAPCPGDGKGWAPAQVVGERPAETSTWRSHSAWRRRAHTKEGAELAVARARQRLVRRAPGQQRGCARDAQRSPWGSSIRSPAAAPILAMGAAPWAWRHRRAFATPLTSGWRAPPCARRGTAAGWRCPGQHCASPWRRCWRPAAAPTAVREGAASAARLPDQPESDRPPVCLLRHTKKLKCACRARMCTPRPGVPAQDHRRQLGTAEDGLIARASAVGALRRHHPLHGGRIQHAQRGARVAAMERQPPLPR